MKAKLKLPTLAAFKRLSIRKRSQVFLKWTKTKKGSYDSISSTHCALAQFAAAMGCEDTCVHGSSRNIYDTPYAAIPVTTKSLIHKPGMSLSVQETRISTFAALSKRLANHLKRAKKGTT